MAERYRCIACLPTAFVATKSANDFAIMPPFTDGGTPIVKIPAFALCYSLNARYQ